MSAALLAYIFVNFLLRLPHTSRCYPQCASSQKRFYFKYSSKRENEAHSEVQGENKGVIAFKVHFDKCSDFVQSDPELGSDFWKWKNRREEITETFLPPAN